MKYYIETKVKSDYASAIARTKEALKKEGFGVLTEIEFHKILKEKLDIPFRKYTVLGACNPPFAHKALLLEDKIGTMLPCNVVVQQIDDDTTEIAAVDPMVSMQGVDNANLNEIATIIKNKLEKVISSL